MMDDDDAQLLRRYAQEGAEEAFAELVRRHLGLIYGSALRRVNGNTALAEEVAQEIFASVAREAERLAEKIHGGLALAGWLYVATKNTAANAVRAEVRRVRRDQEAYAMNEQDTGGVAGVDGEATWAQVRPELEAVMDELNERDREAVLLRFFEGRAFGEIGVALRVSEDAARVRVNRALEKMRELLARRGIKSTAVALGGVLAGNAAVAAPAALVVSVTAAGAVAMGGTALSVGAASAGVAASSAEAASAGILSFMTTTKLVTGVACVVAAVAVGTAVYKTAELERARAVIAAGYGEKEVAMKRAVELERRLGEAEHRAQGAEQTAEDAKKALAEASAKSAGAAPVKSPAAQGMDVANILYADAGFQEASLRMFQTAMPFKYAPFYRKMGLSAGQVVELEKALIARHQAQIDHNAAARSQKMSITDPALLKVANDGLSEAYAELQRVLGEEGLKRFSEFEKAVGAEGESRELLAASLYSDAPLTLEQSERLSEILAANRLSEKIGSVTTYTGYKWNEIGAAITGVLPEEQARFVEAYAERAKAQELWQAYWRAAREGKPLSEVRAGKTK